VESAYREDNAAPASGLERYVQERTAYWEDYAATFHKWESTRRYYRQRLIDYYRFLVPPGMRVLELGCGNGDLLAALQPAYGVGIDLSEAMIGGARQKYPKLHLQVADAHTVTLHETFDYVICSDLVNDLWDVQQVFENIRALCRPSTRVIVNAYSRLWEIPRRIAEFWGLAKPQLNQNWLTAGDIASLFYLADFEVVRTRVRDRLPGTNARSQFHTQPVPGQAVAVQPLCNYELPGRPAETATETGRANGQRDRARPQRSREHPADLRSGAGNGRRNGVDSRGGPFDR
jgi:SAM-dependent methyltransferase